MAASKKVMDACRISKRIFNLVLKVFCIISIDFILRQKVK